MAVGLVVLPMLRRHKIRRRYDKRRVGVYAAIVSFLMFSMIQFRDGPFIRPHPAFWRMVLGINLLYELALFGQPLPERNYADDCTSTLRLFG
ncbi:hypothetical protein MPER_09471 [Moniliophthora perniciosa FA553]|nr:hypothetical protein MPER_09471 [Moniliophthora perniciosa FA553]